jgi:hypothetical protein
MWPAWASSSRFLVRDVTEGTVWRTRLPLGFRAVRSEPLGLRHQLVGGVLQPPGFGNEFVSRLGEFLDERCVVVSDHHPILSAFAES